jgi:hypothetical protein
MFDFPTNVSKISEKSLWPSFLAASEQLRTFKLQNSFIGAIKLSPKIPYIVWKL